MSDDITKPKPYWTFSSSSINIGISGIRVSGWFLWCQIVNMQDDDGDSRQGMRIHYLTPFDEPTTFELPRILVKKPLDAISAHDALEALELMFGELPFQATPAAPSALPMNRVPPSKRAAIQAALAKRKGR